MCSPVNPVSRTYVGGGAIVLRHRIGYYSHGEGVHGSTPHAEKFASAFWNQCGNWALNTNHYFVYYGPGKIQWVGEVGAFVCRSGMHGQGRALDLTRIQLPGNHASDFNWSWRNQQSIGHRRRYLGIVANCRRNFGTVLTCWYNSAHRDHIHVDNGTAVGPIKSSLRTDTTLVQASCNLINGESLAIDGEWGPLTDAAYQRLLLKLNIANYNPRGNTSHALYFLEFIVKHGFANKAAGAYRH